MSFGHALRRRGGGGVARFFRAEKCWVALSLPSVGRAAVLPCTLLERVVPTVPTRFEAVPTSTGDKLSAPVLGLRAILSLSPLSPLKKHPVRSYGHLVTRLAGHPPTVKVLPASGLPRVETSVKKDCCRLLLWGLSEDDALHPLPLKGTSGKCLTTGRNEREIALVRAM
jgi:hypothetical protein